MRPHLVAIPVALVFMLLAVMLGALRLLSIQGITPTPLAFLQLHHGEMMIFGFLAPLILTERYLGAAAFRLPRVFQLMPLLAALGALLKLLSWVSSAAILNTAGSISLAVAVLFYVYVLGVVAGKSAQPLPFRYMSLGAATLLVSALLSINRSPAGNPAFTLLLISFPVLTIIGERVELSRFLAPAVFRRARWGLWGVTLGSILLLLRITAVDSSYLVAAWTLFLAIAVAPLVGPETALVRAGQRGLYRYLGWHLAFAYLWLLIGLVILAVGGETYPLYDAGTHSLAIGFVFTMIMAHAPVIAPVLLKRNVQETKLSYWPLVLLTLSTAMRVAGNVLSGMGVQLPGLSGLSGVAALLAIILFIVMIVRALKPGHNHG